MADSMRRFRRSARGQRQRAGAGEDSAWGWTAKCTLCVFASYGTRLGGNPNTDTVLARKRTGMTCLRHFLVYSTHYNGCELFPLCRETAVCRRGFTFGGEAARCIGHSHVCEDGAGTRALGTIAGECNDTVGEQSQMDPLDSSCTAGHFREEVLEKLGACKTGMKRWS